VRQASGTGWGCCAGKDRLKLVGQSDEACYWAILIEPLGQAAGQTSETGPTWQGIRLGSRRAGNTGGRAYKPSTRDRRQSSAIIPLKFRKIQI
jgi:hypothetical protein